MNTTDPIYWKPLLPHIRISNTADNTIIYEYSSFSGLATGASTTVFPIRCSVSLSQNTFGEFTVSFLDQTHILENAGITVGSRVLIRAAKQSNALVRLISGLVRKKGYSRGADNKVLYTIQGSGTGIRLNENVVYAVSEAAKTSTGAIDFSDTSRFADTLLAANLNFLTADGILSIANLASRSDVETFIASLNIQFGEAQDLVNFIEDQSGGELIVDADDTVHFRYEIKNDIAGRGFTIKNNNANKANDDADDTMYMVNKSWSYDDDFYKSSSFSNRLIALLPAAPVPSTMEELGWDSASSYNSDGAGMGAVGFEFAQKFTPTHSHYLPGDIIVGGGQATDVGPGSQPENWVTRFRIAGPDTSSGATLPNNLPVIVNIDFLASNFTSPPPVVGSIDHKSIFVVAQNQIFYDSSNAQIDSFDLSTVQDYWLIVSNDNVPIAGGSAEPGVYQWAFSTGSTGIAAQKTSSYSTNSSAGSGWATMQRIFCYALPLRRSQAFNMWDPKSQMAISSGLTNGQRIHTTLSDLSPLVMTKEGVYRHLQTSLYNMARPRTLYNFPTVTAPNIPPLPGDPIIINDDVLGFSSTLNQVVITTCGDMTYDWQIGQYDAPTKLRITAVGLHPRYR